MSLKNLPVERGTIICNWFPNTSKVYGIVLRTFYTHGGRWMSVLWEKEVPGFKKNFFLGLCETSDTTQDFGKSICTHAQLILEANKHSVDRINKIKKLIDCGYKGYNQHTESELGYFEWQFNGVFEVPNE